MSDRVEKVEKVESPRFDPSKSGGIGVEKVESPLGLDLSTLPDGPRPKVTDLLLATFGGSRFVQTPTRTWGQPMDEAGWTSIPLTEIQERGWPTRPKAK